MVVKAAELLARAEELAQGSKDGNTLSWATNVLILAELLRGTTHAVVTPLKQVMELNATGKVSDHRLSIAAQGIAQGLLSDSKQVSSPIFTPGSAETLKLISSDRRRAF